jgi:hypothetical protein
MTIEMPKTTFVDRLLALIGKKRAVRIPFEAYDKLGPYVYLRVLKEPFWRALVRPKNQDPPEGWIYPDHIILGEDDDGR